MKKIIFALIALFVMSGRMAAQSWVPVGSPEFSAGMIVGTPDIAIDVSGTPYVVYNDFTINPPYGAATVMKYNGSSWVTVGSPGFGGEDAEFISIAIDGSGTPYVVYADSSYGYSATVVKYNGSSWVTVGSPGFSDANAEGTSIAIDSSGTPYVVYSDEGYNATVMKYNGSNWVTVGSPMFSVGAVAYISIAIDNSGTLYVGYQDLSPSYYEKATVMKYNGSTWVTVGSPGFSAGAASFTKIAIDYTGTPYMVFADNSDSTKATVMKYNGSSWVTVGSAGFSAGTTMGTSIAIDGSGTPYVVYGDGATSILLQATVMKYNGSNWVNVGGAGFSAGQAVGTTIAINGSGTPYVFYIDGIYGGATVMKYGTTSGVNEVFGSSDIQIYPNPLSTTVHIKAPEKVNVTIINVVGQVVLKQDNATDIDMSGLANGMYIIKVYDENNVILKTVKLVKVE